VVPLAISGDLFNVSDGDDHYIGIAVPVRALGEEEGYVGWLRAQRCLTAELGETSWYLCAWCGMQSTLSQDHLGFVCGRTPATLHRLIPVYGHLRAYGHIEDSC
jgi:hypothetical protein